MASASARVPPRWFVRLAWRIHRGLYRLTDGRLGLQRPQGNNYGTLRLTTVGRRTGNERSVIIAYLEDGPNLTGLAMNGWADPEPAWWLNLQAHPEAIVQLPQEQRKVRAHAATGTERSRSGNGGLKSMTTSTATQPSVHGKPPSSSWNQTTAPEPSSGQVQSDNHPPVTDCSCSPDADPPERH